MNKKLRLNFKLIILIGVLLIMLYLVGLSYINSETFIHRLIYERYGLESETYIDYKTLSGVTILKSNQNYSKCNDFCKLSHSINDTIFYSLVIFVFNLWVMFVAYWIWRKYVNQPKKEGECN